MNKKEKRYIRKSIAYVMSVLLIFLSVILNDNYKVKAEENPNSNIDGQSVVELAESYVGKVPYVSGGYSLTTGTDCSGFVKLIYEQFGIDIPGRSSQDLYDNALSYGVYVGTDLSLAMPGDLVFTASSSHGVISHVGIIKNSEEMVHQTVPGSSVKVQTTSYVGTVMGIVRPNGVSAGNADGVSILENSIARVVIAYDYNAESEVEYKWVISGVVDTGDFNMETEWGDDFSTYTFYIHKTGNFTAEVYVRQKGDTSGNILAQSSINFFHQNAVKGKCQMPYTGEGGGYLIGVESYENPNQSYRYEMLILDCTLLAEGKPPWIYSSSQIRVPEGNALWIIWQPQYGYYWTLFRVFDESGNLIGEECYGFQNII